MSGELEYEVRTKRVPGLRVISLRRIVPAWSIGGLISELAGKLRWPPCGPPGAVYHDRDSDPSRVDVEVLFPVPLGGDRVVSGGDMAYVTYVGPYTGIWKASKALRGWIDEHGLKMAGPRREMFLLGPGSDVDPGEYVTEIQIPVTPLEQPEGGRGAGSP